ncbi:MAG: hypothetical protein V7745_02490 [Pseudomonadales bacterium]
MVDIDRSVKAYYDDKKLSEQQLQHLLALESDEKNSFHDQVASAPTRLASLPLRFALTFAAGLVLAVSVFFAGDWASPDITDRVAQEVAMNHNKALAVEYQTDSYQTLSRVMNKLDFDLLAPRLMTEGNLSLLGARYCSIQGQLAAQLKLVDNSGRIYTLYQTRLNDELKAINSDVLQQDQVTIRLWGEQGILYGLAVVE